MDAIVSALALSLVMDLQILCARTHLAPPSPNISSVLGAILKTSWFDEATVIYDAQM